MENLLFKSQFFIGLISLLAGLITSYFGITRFRLNHPLHLAHVVIHAIFWYFISGLSLTTVVISSSLFLLFLLIGRVIYADKDLMSNYKSFTLAQNYRDFVIKPTVHSHVFVLSVLLTPLFIVDNKILLFRFCLYLSPICWIILNVYKLKILRKFYLLYNHSQNDRDLLLKWEKYATYSSIASFGVYIIIIIVFIL
jgi:hypothetical protein